MFGLFRSTSAPQDVSPAAAQALIAQGAPVVDVREPNEFAAGAIKGSINVPLGAIQQRGSAALADAADPRTRGGGRVGRGGPEAVRFPLFQGTTACDAGQGPMRRPGA